MLGRRPSERKTRGIVVNRSRVGSAGRSRRGLDRRDRGVRCAMLGHVRFDRLNDDTPRRLAVIAKLAFHDGGMTASGLRREAERGRLAVERIAGKDFTSFQAIAEMRKACRVERKEHLVFHTRVFSEAVGSIVLAQMDARRGKPSAETQELAKLQRLRERLK